MVGCLELFILHCLDWSGEEAHADRQMPFRMTLSTGSIRAQATSPPQLDCYDSLAVKKSKNDPLFLIKSFVCSFPIRVLRLLDPCHGFEMERMHMCYSVTQVGRPGVYARPAKIPPTVLKRVVSPLCLNW